MQLEDVDLIDVIDDVHELHLDGKLEVRATHPVRTLHDLRRVYTPGVAEVVRGIAADPDESYRYTIRGKTVAIVTNGTRVLGLGNVGPLAALPVMEGKAALLHQFAAFGLPARARHPRRRRDRGDGDAPGVRLRRDPARGHRVAGALRGRAPPGRCARHAGAPRRPARHCGRSGGGDHNAMARAGLDLARARVRVIGLGAAGAAIARMLGAVTAKPVIGFDPSPDADRAAAQSGGSPPRASRR